MNFFIVFSFIHRTYDVNVLEPSDPLSRRLSPCPDVLRFTKEVCPTSNMVTKEISSTLAGKIRASHVDLDDLLTGELNWIANQYDEAYIFYILLVSEECFFLFVWRILW